MNSIRFRSYFHGGFIYGVAFCILLDAFAFFKLFVKSHITCISCEHYHVNNKTLMSVVFMLLLAILSCL